MAPKKRTTRLSLATTTTTTTPMTDDQLKALIAQGVADVLAERGATRSKNGEDNHDSRTSVRRQAPLAREPEKDDDQQELAFMCVRMFSEESDKIKKYVGGLPDMIHRSVMASKPNSMQDVIEFATEMMDKKIITLAKRQAKNKRKLDNNNQAQKQPPKKQGVAIAYTDGSGERKEYAGTLPLCNKCKFHHNGQCIVKCANCKRVGHLTRDCRSPAATNNQGNLTSYECGDQGVAIAYITGSGERKEYARTLPLCNKCKFHHNGQCTVKCTNCKRVGHLTRDCRSPTSTNNQRNLTCYKFGDQGHYRSDCPELKNQNHGNQAEGTGARGMVYALGG
ncbi:reverse transcriptase domain-containing protein [Tanacetum coccineum]